MTTFQSLIDAFRGFANFLTDPRIFFALSIVVLVAMFRFKGWVKPRPAMILGLGATIFFIVSLFDKNFAKIVMKPDNVPIAGMLFLVGFFLWVAFKQAFDNDERMAKGLPPSEAEEADAKILVWPDLVYSEFICLILLTVILVVWAIALQAPIEEPANPTKAPNPSKAPWYFLGLQEMLVYFDPWMAGVVLPSLIIVGLICSTSICSIIAGESGSIAYPIVAYKRWNDFSAVDGVSQTFPARRFPTRITNTSARRILLLCDRFCITTRWI
jgi:hypothetical protein